MIILIGVLILAWVLDPVMIFPRQSMWWDPVEERLKFPKRKEQ